MSTCLGLYIEENLIKYAKVSKDHDQVKVESFGVKFYENIDQTIKQIVICFIEQKGFTKSYKYRVRVLLC